ncbi:MAG: helix-turn-helix domain-containing protein [Gammaproteobacteria bacterium]|nr:helix-turn-helix domain-containing protein [Gammaproteobacteria bacterium]
MHSLATLITGYSIFAALVIGLTHFRSENYFENRLSQLTGIALVSVLGLIQLLHAGLLLGVADLIHSLIYLGLLFCVAPLFYLFSMPLLHAKSGAGRFAFMHFLPIFLAFLVDPELALPLAFAFGSGYLVWLIKSIYGLRMQRSRFRIEITILGMVILVAFGVVTLVLTLPKSNEQLFYELYAIAIGLGFLLTSILLHLKPSLASDVAEVARETYAVSTLGQVDCGRALSRLETLMQTEQVYTSPELKLEQLAQQLDLSGHQLSELINTRLGKNFSRYLREVRVEAAKAMLTNEPSASVLSVALSVGFATQSNFYDAFNEICGMTPGKYRKIKKI